MNIPALALTLRDAAALADIWGPGSTIGLGVNADITGPARFYLTPAEATGLTTSFLAASAPPDVAAIMPLAAMIDQLTAAEGTGFMVACLADPAAGATIYQSHLFQDGRLIADLRQALGETLAGRIAVVPQELIESGAQAVRGRLSWLKEQGTALALLDCINIAQTQTIRSALAGQSLIAGPAWLAPAWPNAAETPTLAARGPLAILSGARHRQTIFQLGAARFHVPFLQLDPAAPAGAVEWALTQNQDSFIIATSAPPDRLGNPDDAAAALAETAAGLAAAGITRFLFTGNDTAVACLARLGIKTLTAAFEANGLRWFAAGGYSILLKPGGFGGRDLLRDNFGPQQCRIAAAQ